METTDERQGFVTCKECGKKFGMITPQHLRAVHNLTTEQYKEKHPEQDLWGKGFRSSFKYSDTSLFKNIDDIDKIPKLGEIKIPKDLEEIQHKVNEARDMEKKDFPQGKYEVFEALKNFFSYVETNYFVEKVDNERRLEYRVITDFCDPINKIIIDFPNCYWHNFDISSESLKDQVLPGHGWKVIKILSRDPTSFTVEQELQKYKGLGILDS